MRDEGNKTDRADARLIAEYASRERSAPWQPPRPEVRALQALSRRRDDLRRLAAGEKTRLAAPGLSAAVRRSLARAVAFLAKEAGRLQAEADELVAGSEGLRVGRDLLQTIPGVGPVAADAILAELPDPSRFASAQQAAAYAGLAPREYRSGTSVRKRTRLSKAGNARLRMALYLPALTAARFNPLVAAFYERLVAAGKPRMAAVGACMRKLLMIAYGVLKSRTAFDPTRGSKMAPRQHTIWFGLRVRPRAALDAIRRRHRFGRAARRAARYAGPGPTSSGLSDGMAVLTSTTAQTTLGRTTHARTSNPMM